MKRIAPLLFLSCIAASDGTAARPFDDAARETLNAYFDACHWLSSEPGAVARLRNVERRIAASPHARRYARVKAGVEAEARSFAAECHPPDAADNVEARKLQRLAFGRGVARLEKLLGAQ